MKKKTLTEELVFEDFQRAVVFLTLIKIKKNFKNASEYANSKHTDKAKYLHIDSKTLKRLSTFDNRRLFNKFLQKSADLFNFHKHVAFRYASRKKFKINSWFELKLSIDQLDKYLESKHYMDLKSELYSKRIHKILDNLFNNKKKKKDNTTKTEEKKEEDNIPDVPPEPAHAKPPVDDIPTDEEQKEDKAKLLSFKLQEFLDKKYLQLYEAETLKKYSIYSSEIPALEDKKHVNLDDTDSRWQHRANIARYIQKHMHEFNIDNWNENKYPKNWAVKALKNEDFMKKKARLS